MALPVQSNVSLFVLWVLNLGPTPPTTPILPALCIFEVPEALGRGLGFAVRGSRWQAGAHPHSPQVGPPWRTERGACLALPD